MNNKNECVILMDNGSHRPESTLTLRKIASKLSDSLSVKVNPVSLLHSTKVSSEKLNGIKAEILEPYIIKQCEQGVDSFYIVPFFFGQSGALKDYLPERLNEIKKNWSNVSVNLAPTLVNMEDKEDFSVSNIIAEFVEDKILSEKLVKPYVTLVDHGTPLKEVNNVRNHITNQLKILLGDKVLDVKASSMERRDGKQYEFNEPLLENILGSGNFIKNVILAMLFISPGRHAGKDGDIDQICEKAEQKCATLKTYKSELFAEHPDVIKILSKRYNEGKGLQSL